MLCHAVLPAPACHASALARAIRLKLRLLVLRQQHQQQQQHSGAMQARNSTRCAWRLLPVPRHAPCDEVLCDACHVLQQGVCSCWPVADGPSTPPIQLIQLTFRTHDRTAHTAKQDPLLPTIRVDSQGCRPTHRTQLAGHRAKQAATCTTALRHAPASSRQQQQAAPPPHRDAPRMR